MYQHAVAYPLAVLLLCPLTAHKKVERDLKNWRKADFVYIKIHERMVWPLISRSQSVCLKGHLLKHRPGQCKKFSSYAGNNALFF